MKLKDISSQLANRINQPKVIEVYLRQVYAKGFVNGTKQSPWINVEEKLPDTDNGQSLCEVLAQTYDGRFAVFANVQIEDLAERGEVVRWMPIPEV